MLGLILYNQGYIQGADVILHEMESMGVRPLPSLKNIHRILTSLDLTHRRTGYYP